MDTRRSLVLVTVDCLRADHAGFMGYEHPTTPFLDSLALESIVVPNAIVGGAPTYYSFPTILASRYPLALGRDVVGLAPEEPSLAAVLQQAGYRTAAFIAANPYLSRQFGYDEGFETFADFLQDELATLPGMAANGNSSTRGTWNRSLEKFCRTLGPLGAAYDELYFQYLQRLALPRPVSLDSLRRFPAADVIVDQARAWLAALGQNPFFLWLHLMDLHSPYYPAAQALRLMRRAEFSPFRARYLNAYWNRSDLGPNRLKRHREAIIALYDAGIRWVDSQMARLVDALRQLHLWDNCLFAFTADHGEEFVDHGGRYHPPDRLNEELIHVPLLLRVPETKKTHPSKAPLSHLHLAPTLLDAMNLPAPAEFQGRSHLPQLLRGEGWDKPAIVECVTGCTNPFRVEARTGARVLAVREARYKLVIHFNPPSEELFDLETDRREFTPLPPDAEKAVRRRLLDYARLHLSRASQTRDPLQRLRARLRELRLEWARCA